MNNDIMDPEQLKLMQELMPNPIDYDLSGYLDKYKTLPDQSQGQHLTDEFKLPNHITFSTDSIYSNKNTPGGTWSKDDLNVWHYKPSDFVLKQHGEQKLINYFNSPAEPFSVLDLPEKK